MLEIIALIVLVGIIQNMASRRGRSRALFALLLLVCWLGGEAAGALIGLLLSVTAQAYQPNILIIYGLAFAGGAVGVAVAFLAARSFRPVDGVWREPAEPPVRGSRLLGAVVGGVGGGLVGCLVAAVMYGGAGVEEKLPMITQAALGVGFIGALLGLVSGLQKGSGKYEES